MASILVFAEHFDSKIKNSSKDLIYAAKSSGEDVAVVFDCPESASLLTQAGHLGASKAYFAKSDSLKEYHPQMLSSFYINCIKKEAPRLLLANSSAVLKDVLPRVAAVLNLPVASDCISLNFKTKVATKPLYAGKCLVDINFKDSSVPVVLMRPNQLPPAPENSTESNQPEAISLELDSAFQSKLKVKQVVQGLSKTADLTEANIIVSGGRGLKAADNFKLVEELAGVLGATVGASRAIVDDGWVAHSLQVGQTGKTVAPSLYIAVGISGAIQHLAGMSGSKVIVAINQDAEAPIFQKATYGIVGDLFAIVPELTNELRKVLK